MKAQRDSSMLVEHQNLVRHCDGCRSERHGTFACRSLISLSNDCVWECFFECCLPVLRASDIGPIRLPARDRIRTHLMKQLQANSTSSSLTSCAHEVENWLMFHPVPALHVTHVTIMCCLCSSSLVTEVHWVELRRLALVSVRIPAVLMWRPVKMTGWTCEKFCTRANVKNEASGIMHDSKEVSVQQMFNVETPKIPYCN